MVFFFLSLFLLKLVFFLSLLFAIFVLGLKLWLQPITGVCKCKTKLHGKVALVTGGTSGIGLETARDLARRGARVIIASIEIEKSEAVVSNIVETTGNFDVQYKHLDLSKFRSIKRFCEDLNNTVDRLDILVNNAGYGGVKREVTEDGIDMVMQINYLGPFLLTNLLLKKLTDSRPSRIVIVASNAARRAKLDPEDVAGINTRGYWTMYCNSKLCNIIWAKALAKKLPRGVTANSLHPGIVKTNIYNQIPHKTLLVLFAVIKAIFKTPKEAAQTSIHLSVAPELEGISGKFYSDCKPDVSIKAAEDEELIEKVWRESVRLTGS